MSRIKCPLPIFDNINFIKECADYVVLDERAFPDDYKHAIEFLKSYTGSEGTFNSYRSEIERLLHWSWLKKEKSIKDLKRADIEEFIKFCQRPPKPWIGKKIVARFVERAGKRQPNREWRPFVVKVSKSAHKSGQK